jgi:hypothetical protein
MSAPDRERLARAQDELVSALAGRGAVPYGFDAEGIAVAASMLQSKRMHSVAHAWPGLARALGQRFEEKFGAFAKLNSIPPHGSALEDGRAFARALARIGELPEEGRLEVFMTDLRYKEQGSRLTPRRGIAIKAALFKTPPRLIIALRIPSPRRGKGPAPVFVERRFTLPLKPR